MVNKVILIGNVGLDPEVRTTEGGVKVAASVWRRRSVCSTGRRTRRRNTPSGIRSPCGAVLPTWWTVLSAKARKSISRGACAPANGWTRTTTNAIRPKFWPIREPLGRRSEPTASDGAPAPSYGAQPQGASWPAGRLSAADTPSGSGSAAPAGSSFSPGRRSGRPAFLIFDL